MNTVIIIIKTVLNQIIISLMLVKTESKLTQLVADALRVLLAVQLAVAYPSTLFFPTSVSHICHIWQIGFPACK